MSELDTSKLALAIFDADDNLVVTGTTGANSDGQFTATLTGLPANQVVAAGAYKEAFTDGTNYGPKVALGGFSTLANPSQATNLVDSAVVDTAVAE